MDERTPSFKEPATGRFTLRFIVHVILPTAVGTSIYIGWRSTDLLVFRWIELCGLSGLVYRPAVQLPEWVLYSLPDGCWVYATTSWMLLVWQRMNAWVWAGVVLGVACEIGQLFGFIQGTYQTLDIAFYIGAFFIAGVVHAKTPHFDFGDLGDDISGVRQHG